MNPSQLILIGFGQVCRTLMTIMCVTNMQMVKKLPILIIEPKDINSSLIYQKICKLNPNVTHLQIKISADNYIDIFNQNIKKNAIVIDLAYRVDTASIIQECQRKHCLYVNTAIDFWEHNDLTLFKIKQSILQNVTYKPSETKMTAVLNHGMNPGLVSHLVKLVLEKLAKESGNKTNIDLCEQKKYNYLAQKLGLTLVQIAERDNQVTQFLSNENQFFNTWSVIGLLDESLNLSEITWGTHEKKMPINADRKDLHASGQIVLPVLGSQVRTLSYEPKGGLLTGYGIPHAECYSLAKFLRIGDQYRPSIYYSYLIPDTAKLLCHYAEYKLDKNYNPQSEHVLHSSEITDGYDSVGCLFFFRTPKLKKYWMGSIVSNQMALEISPEINGTCTQVAASVMACIEWMILHPHMGIIEPEMVDSHFIVDYCRDWLGEFYFKDVTNECDINTDQFADLVRSPANLF